MPHHTTMQEYPHSLIATLSTPDSSYRDADTGEWVLVPSTTNVIEVDARGLPGAQSKARKFIDGNLVEYDYVISTPNTGPVIPAGTSVVLRDKRTFIQLAEGTVDRFHPGDFGINHIYL